MTTPDSLLGKFGECVVATEFLRSLNELGQSMFDPCSLGEKAELLDFVVRLQTAGRPHGPYFFVQVKATSKKPSGGSISARFDLSEVQCAQAMRAPVYIAAVDASNRNLEEIYIQPVYSDRRQGISRIKTSRPLSDPGVCAAIFDEVDRHFAQSNSEFKAPQGYQEESFEEEESDA